MPTFTRRSYLGVNNPFFGKHHTEEVRKKLGKNRLGTKHETTLATREKIREKHLGMKHSDLTKKKMSDARVGKYIGSNNPAWAGGVTPKNKIIRHGIEFRLWREEVYKRDNYTCQKCGSRSQKKKIVYLHPHHIQNFSKFILLRFLASNGITFCENCHKEFHKIFGRRNNTKEQIIDFLK